MKETAKVNRPKQEPRATADTQSQSSMKNSFPLKKIQSAFELQLRPHKFCPPNMFPARKSNYIGHLRSQAFVNNIRLRFLNEDGNVPDKYFPKRSHSAPVFSTTMLKTLSEKDDGECPERTSSERKCKSASHNRAVPGDLSGGRVLTGHDSRSSGCSEGRRSLPIKRVYGRFKSTGSDPVLPQTHGHFFKVVGVGIKPPCQKQGPSSLFRGYTTRTENRLKSAQLTTQQSDPVTRARMDYERQTDQLLNYYSRKFDTDGDEACPKEAELHHNDRDVSPPAVFEAPLPAYQESHFVPQSQTCAYYINLKAKKRNGRYVAPVSPFILISRQAMLHDKRGCQQRNVCSYNGFHHKQCDCSVCQSDLHLDTSRLSLSPDSPKSNYDSNKDMWVNPSGVLKDSYECGGTQTSSLEFSDIDLGQEKD